MAKQENFETSLARLEEIVKRLEEGKLSLDESIRLFEEGVKHAAICNRRLTDAEKKVEILLKQKDGNFLREPFAGEE
ncbi:MAG: exodeoxyribonuclease VII small subunit [Desulfuromonadia bacterium]